MNVDSFRKVLSRSGRMAPLIIVALLGSNAQGDYPTPGNPKSLPGRPILSVPVDPFMTPADEQRILLALARPARLQWQATSPAFLAKELCSYFPASVNRRALEDIGLEVDMEIGLEGDSGSLSLGANLEEMFEAADLAMTIRGGRFIITTREDSLSESRLPTRIYDVTPLVVRQQGDHSVVYAQGLMDTIQATIEPGCWEALGGPSVMGLNVVRDRALLHISASTSMQLRIQSYLDRSNSGPSIDPSSSLFAPEMTFTGTWDTPSFHYGQPGSHGMGGMMRIAPMNSK
jgi:hypothetical protein